MNQNNPTFTIIAGVNGAGKTTFALDYFKNSDVLFINTDLIATGFFCLITLIYLNLELILNLRI